MLTADHLRAALADEAFEIPRMRSLAERLECVPGGFPGETFEAGVPPLFRAEIRPTVIPAKVLSGLASDLVAEQQSGRISYLGCPARWLVETTAQMTESVTSARLDIRAEIPEKHYDLAIWPGEGQRRQQNAMMRRVVEAGLGVEFRREERLVPVYVLSATPEAGERTASDGEDIFEMKGVDDGDTITIDVAPANVGLLVSFLELSLDRPVVDESGLQTGRFRGTWHRDDLASAQTALQEMGLTLTPADRTISFVVVENTAVE
jgi:uncharacterized protein (TIGR03435 family)